MIQTLLHILFWFLIFFQGVFELLNLPSFLHKLIPQLIVIVLLINKILLFQLKTTPFFRIVFSLFIITLISKILNFSDLFLTLYFMNYLFFSYLYILLIVNESSLKRLRLIFRFIIFMFLIQLPASWIKYSILGQTEQGAIGTVSVLGGSISTILPTFAIIFLICKYFFEKNLKYIFLIVLFFLFALIGEKRAISGYLPIFVILSYFIYNYKLNNILKFKTFKNIIVVFFALSIIFYSAVRLSPTLNSQNKIGGQFDLNFFNEYVIDYYDSSDEDFSEMQRLEGFTYFSNFLYKQGFSNFLFGNGPGHLIGTRYGNESNFQMLDKYGVRYGGRMGAIFMYLQIGFIGIVLYISLIFKLYFFVWRNYKNNYLYLSFLVLTWLFVLDFFTYSIEFYKQTYLSGVYFFLFSLIYLDVNSSNVINKIIK